MSKRSKISRVRTLYAIMLGMIACCIALVVVDVLLPAEHDELLQLPDSRYALRVTDLAAPADIYLESHAVHAADSTCGMSSHVRTFDLDVAHEGASDSRVVWSVVLQVVSSLLLLVVLGMVVHVLISFYVNTKRGRFFPSKNLTKLRWVGILIIVLSLLADVSLYLERSYAIHLLEGSPWQPSASITIHFTRLILGLTIIIMTEILIIGRQMQDEQELTI